MAGVLAAGQLLHSAGAVVCKGEKGGIVVIVQADAGVAGGLADLGTRSELGVLIGHYAVPAVPVGYMGMGGGVEIALASDVQPGVVPLIDVLGAENALAVMVVEGLPGHQQLQKLVPARAEGAHLGDDVGAGVDSAQPADVALHLGFDQDGGGRQAPLRPRVLPGAVADVVDHHAHHPAAAGLGLPGEGIGIVRGKGGGAAGSGLGRSRRGRGGRSAGGSGPGGAEQALQPVQQAALGADAHQGQTAGESCRAAQKQAAGDLHRGSSLLCNGIQDRAQGP